VRITYKLSEVELPKAVKCQVAINTSDLGGWDDGVEWDDFMGWPAAKAVRHVDARESSQAIDCLRQVLDSKTPRTRPLNQHTPSCA